jgi:tetratricopeptide (TPR) repeat protein
VKLFEAGSYDDAARQFREAVRLSPDDSILPFTYAQALFAEGDYAMAASVLREAMVNIPADDPTIYYPRGLYPDDDVLKAQIKALEKAAAEEPFSADYNLLLGYQYLGLGELDKVARPLSRAAQSPANTDAAGKLLDLAAKLEEAEKNN